jgi:Peptidase family M23
MKGLALLLPVLVALQVGVQPALAWAWPVDGPVLRPFVLGDDPYAGGQHRGVDIGAPAGTPVRAPAAGTVSFAGTVPTGGKTITIRTADGYAVTLQRLGSTSVLWGLAVGEGDVVGSVGQATEPYVYLGVRKADEPDGYVDPLGLLPPLAPAPAPDEPAPVEPDPVPTPAHGSGSRHHSHTFPAPEAVEEPSVEPAPAPRARTSRRPEVRRPPTEGVAGSPGHARAAQLPEASRSPVSLPDATVLRAATRTGKTVAAAADAGPRPVWTAAGLAALLGLGGLCAWLARRRRELGDAVAAHGTSPVLLQGVTAPTEDAHRLRLGQEDDVVLHRDLERVLLAEREALPDLDGDDDPAQVVDVPDDSRLRCPPYGALLHRTLCRSVRRQRISAFRLRRTPRNRSPALPFLTIIRGCGAARSHSYDCRA